MRYNYVLSCLFCLLGVSSLWGQQKKIPYLFDEFQNAIVYLKQGGQSKEKINYDMVSEAFCFIQQNGEINLVLNPEDIIAIQIGNRTFYPEKKGGVEILATTPAVYVQYKAAARAESPKGAYGGGTETSSVRSYSSVQSNNLTYNLTKPEIEIIKQYNIYWIEKDSKKKQFKNFKQFVKLYPKHTQELDRYIKENQVRFDDVDMIVKLCLYAESL